MGELVKELQIVISIIKSRNWEEDGVWVARLGLEEIAGISQQELDGLWSYTLWNKEHTSHGGFPSRLEAAFHACRFFIKTQGIS